jgi:hypothetical protein
MNTVAMATVCSFLLLFLSAWIVRFLQIAEKESGALGKKARARNLKIVVKQFCCPQRVNRSKVNSNRNPTLGRIFVFWFSRFPNLSAHHLIGRINGHQKAGCSAVKFFDDHDCAFGLRLWNAHLTKPGAVPKGAAKYVIKNT